ncbi:hypothetical protein CMV_013111 [Castanea mollissima]|uniref:SET domain-containing protein n=1 Tax=Castanea mollissima TaxID=60419 RepID=A0A8J4RE29_9ROSI|nr:hypothetical protein CMV_013111 [Castanea mollissima]
MAFLFNKFQEAVKTLAKSPTFARDPRQLQFEADINRLFLYTSYNRLGRDAEEADAEEIIEMATAPRRSGLGFAVGRHDQPTDHPVVPETRSLKCTELSERLKDLIGYKLDIKPSQIPHKEAGQGLYLDGEADVGTAIAFYPGVIYSPAYYRYIPGYPRVDAHNTYLITRYDGTVINAQPWGLGGETREVWDGLSLAEFKPDTQGVDKGSDRFWKMLNTPLVGTQAGLSSDVLERRNPLAFAHFANHPAKAEEVKMKRLGSFWFKFGGSGDGGPEVPVLKTLVLVATRALHDEEILLNYRLSNSKRRPAWYTPVDEEEDRRRWS